MFLRRRLIAILFLGDVFILYASIFPTIFLHDVRTFGDQGDYVAHLIPFSLLIVVWLAVFLIAGLYDKETLFFRHMLPSRIAKAQTVNGVIGIIFFYFIPIFSITPKTNLFIYLLISFVSLLLWRAWGVKLFTVARRHKTLLIGEGKDFHTLVREFGDNNHYGVDIVHSIDIGSSTHARTIDDITKEIPMKGIYLVIIDMRHEKIGSLLPHLYNFLFSGVRFLDMHAVYEEVFKRVPLSRTDYRWFLEHVSLSSHAAYDVLKRSMDIIIGFALGVVSLLVYPFVYCAIKLDDGGKIFVVQRRVGKGNNIVRLLKFRTMEFDDAGKWETGAVNRVTRVGEFLRKTRIDELPQLWNVLQGSISLIGPRPEFPDAVRQYTIHIPHYNIRHLIKPGLSGWAQILHENHPHHKTDVEETAVKLSYDLYYMKHRSIALDLEIALKTIRILLSRKGI